MVKKRLWNFAGFTERIPRSVYRNSLNTRLMNAQNEVEDLKDQEDAIYREIGKLAFDQRLDGFTEQESRLEKIRFDIKEAEANLESLKKSDSVAAAN